jgi:hypothetical protein
MSEGEGGFTERRWMPFTELSPLRIEIEELKREIFEDCGSPVSTQRPGFMGLPTAVSWKP